MTARRKAKQRGPQDQIDHQGQLLLRNVLPEKWVLRDYKPDFGIDYTIEVFEELQGTDNLETLGEHVFVQLKSKSDIKPLPYKIYGRENVEKGQEHLDKKELIKIIDTYRITLEMEELITIERMGAGVPVLLVVADVKNKRCCFICVNDYIDKVLVPSHDDYRNAAHRTIHVPVPNDLSTAKGREAFQWFALRPKLYAAFQKFAFQLNELGYAGDNLRPLAEHFAKRVIAYDFWDRKVSWKILPVLGAAVKHFIEHGHPGTMRMMVPPESLSPEARALLEREEILSLWKQLAGLANVYEDLVREAYLPTAAGVLTTSG